MGLRSSERAQALGAAIAAALEKLPRGQPIARIVVHAYFQEDDAGSAFLPIIRIEVEWSQHGQAL